MNQLLFDRETGSLSSKAFARLEATKLLNSLQLSGTRFDGGEVSRVPNSTDDEVLPDETVEDESTWASKAGVNAIVIDKFENRLCVDFSLLYHNASCAYT